MESDETAVYCICRKPYDDAFMIQCDECKDWFHGSCVGVQEHVAAQIERYHCPICEKNHGPLTLKERSIYEHIDAGAEGRVKTGLSKMIKDLKQRNFGSADEVVRRLRGRDLTVQYLEENGFNHPIMVEKKDGLDLRVPPPSFSVEDVEKKVGPMLEIDVIDVQYQEDYKMLMRQWTDYYNSPGKREKTLNVISLEFSKTDLSPLVEPPRIVREMSWVSSLWPGERFDEMVPGKPEVQKYCLMGVKDSYTDFHIDFGGTSVWYHVLKGEKVFYFVEPTEENLRLFEVWESSSKQTQTFFGDMVDQCWRLVVKQGQTVFIPTAWIHAVYTPIDSLVFGGNFLHIYNVPLQLEAYEIERRLQTNEKYQFPSYETVNWFAAKYIHDNLHACAEMKQPPPPYMLSGGEALARHLKKWTQRKDLNNKCVYSKKGDDPAQLEGISYGKLIKELNSVLKKLNTGAGKTHKTSKRKGKKAAKTKLSAPKLSAPSEEKKPVLLRLGVHKLKEEKTEELDMEQRKNVYNFQDDEDEEAPPPLPLKVRLPKPETISSRAEEQKVSPIKLGKLVKEGESSNKRKRKHKKNRASKRSKKETVSIEAETEKAPEDSKIRVKKTVGRKGRGLFGMVKEEDEDSDKDTLVVDETPNAQLTNRTKTSPVKPVTLKLKAESTVGREGGDTSPPPPAPAAAAAAAAPQPLSDREEGEDSIRDILRGIQFDSNVSVLSAADTSQLMAAESMLDLKNQPTTAARPRPTTSAAEEEEQLMAGCYQDSDYMYMSYEMDEDQLEGPSAKVQEKDDSWNPKARVTVPHKAEERVQRTGAKNQAIASGLAATAKKLEENPQLIKKAARKMPSGKGKESRVPGHSFLSSSPEMPMPGPSTSAMPGPSTSGSTPTPPQNAKRVVDRTPTAVKHTKKDKNKKGYKTAKQRIGKLLKIF